MAPLSLHGTAKSPRGPQHHFDPDTIPVMPRPPAPGGRGPLCTNSITKSLSHTSPARPPADPGWLLALCSLACTQRGRAVGLFPESRDGAGWVVGSAGSEAPAEEGFPRDRQGSDPPGCCSSRPPALPQIPATLSQKPQDCTGVGSVGHGATAALL